MRANHPEPGSAAQPTTLTLHPSRSALKCSECAWLPAAPMAQVCTHPHTPVSPVDGLPALAATSHRGRRLGPAAMESMGMTAWCGPEGSLFAPRVAAMVTSDPCEPAKVAPESTTGPEPYADVLQLALIALNTAMHRSAGQVTPELANEIVDVVVSAYGAGLKQLKALELGAPPPRDSLPGMALQEAVRVAVDAAMPNDYADAPQRKENAVAAALTVVAGYQAALSALHQVRSDLS